MAGDARLEVAVNTAHRKLREWIGDQRPTQPRQARQACIACDRVAWTASGLQQSSIRRAGALGGSVGSCGGGVVTPGGPRGRSATAARASSCRRRYPCRPCRPCRPYHRPIDTGARRERGRRSAPEHKSNLNQPFYGPLAGPAGKPSHAQSRRVRSTKIAKENVSEHTQRKPVNPSTRTVSTSAAAGRRAPQQDAANPCLRWKPAAPRTLTMQNRTHAQLIGVSCSAVVAGRRARGRAGGGCRTSPAIVGSNLRISCSLVVF